MPQQTCTSALLQCSFGAAPSPFMAMPIRTVHTSNLQAGNVTDHVPMLNIKPFGMCSAPSNPMVIAATAAALGVFTPMPCLPVTPAPWVPGVPTVLVENMPALDNNCKLMCAWQGVISFSTPGQFTHDIP